MKAAAKEAQTDAQRKSAADILQHEAFCLSAMGRCTDATELWSLSVATDPNASATPKLSAKCP